MKVLLVDDDTDFSEAVTTLLTEDLGHEVVSAEDGEKALSILLPDGTAASIDTTIDAIITDCNMTPGKSGLSFVQSLARKGVKLPTLLHSGDSVHYEGGMRINLPEVSKYLQFVKFHRKDPDCTYISTFLNEIAQQS